MSDQAAYAGRVVGPARVRRWLALVAMSFIVVPLLLVYGYLLLYFLPDLTGRGPCGGSSGSWAPDRDALEWMTACAIWVSGAVCYGVALGRWTLAGRWWPWPLAACVLLILGASVLGGALGTGPHLCPAGR